MKIKQKMSSECSKKISRILLSNSALKIKGIEIIKILSADFNVPTPKIEETDNKRQDAACYLRQIQTIIFNWQKIKEENQLLAALLHEFAHHLQNIAGDKKTYNKPYYDRPEEIQADIFACRIKKQIFSAEGEMCVSGNPKSDK